MKQYFIIVGWQINFRSTHWNSLAPFQLERFECCEQALDVVERSRSSRRECGDEFIVSLQLALHCEHLVLSERSLGGCIGFGGSAQAGEKPKHCCCVGIDKPIDRQLIEHNFILSLSHIVLTVVVKVQQKQIIQSSDSRDYSPALMCAQFNPFPCSYWDSLPRRAQVKGLNL